VSICICTTSNLHRNRPYAPCEFKHTPTTTFRIPHAIPGINLGKMHTNADVPTYTHAHIYVHANPCGISIYVHIYMRAYVHTYMRVHLRTRTHTYIHTPKNS